jgi:hypothetical protein
MASLRGRWIVLLFAGLSLFVNGCGRPAPVAPQPAEAQSSGNALESGRFPDGGFFPLAVGNRWHSVSADTIRIDPIGNGPPLAEFTITSDITRVLIGTETLFGRSYFVQEETASSSGALIGRTASAFSTWTRYRQDRSGLYEADVDVSRPPTLDDGPCRRSQSTAAVPGVDRARSLPASLVSRLPAAQRSAFSAAWDRLQERETIIRTSLLAGSGAGPGRGQRRGPLGGEIVRLKYPLHSGATWVIRADPLFSSTVDDHEVLALTCGRFSSYDIRIDSDLIQAGEFVRLWFGRSGQLAFRYRLVALVVDSEGNEIGTLVDDHGEVLRDFTLVKP